jgi:hypothetical protein
MKPSNAVSDIKTELAFDLRLSHKMIKIGTPAAYFIWPEGDAFVQLVAIKFIYNCGFNCSSAAYSAEGLLHMDMHTGHASLPGMALTTFYNQWFSGLSDFSLNQRRRNKFIDQGA